MGLSATQARLLTITSRKSDCEFRSMQYSHEKLSLSRDMDRLSNQYQNSLNQTKLMYDFYGTGASTEQLNYNTLISPSALNDYLPITITNNANRLVLNSKYASAAKAAGIPQEGLGCVPSTIVRDKFIAGLVNSDLISNVQASSILKVPYSQGAGIGSTTQVEVKTESISYKEFANRLRDTKIVPTNSSFNPGLLRDLQVDKYIKGTNTTKSLNSNFGPVELTFGDVMSDDYEYVLKAVGKDDNNNLTVAGGMTDAICNSDFWDTMFSAVEGVLDNGKPEIQAALNYAKTKVTSMMTNLGKVSTDSTVGAGNSDYSDQGKNIHTNFGNWRHYRDKYDNDIFNVSKDQATRDTIGLNGIYNNDNDGSADDDSCMSIVTVNLSTMLKSYLTFFAKHLEGLDNANPTYDVTNNKNSSKFIDDSYKFDVISEIIFTKDESKIANHYDTLLNQIATCGWLENDEVDDNTYLKEMLQNGMMFITSVESDGYYTQQNYASWVYVQEVSDSAIVSQAEANYNTMKDKLNAKEQKLDLKMKNLDTEISALNTEYDSVKNVISKCIEKSFKRYNA